MLLEPDTEQPRYWLNGEGLILTSSLDGSGMEFISFRRKIRNSNSRIFSKCLLIVDLHLFGKSYITHIKLSSFDYYNDFLLKIVFCNGT